VNQKRNTLKKVAGVSAVVALAPSSWTKPIVSSVLLPAHAQTSMANVAPEFTQSVFNTGVVVNDSTNDIQEIIDLATVSTDLNNDSLSFSITSITAPEQSAWDGTVNTSPLSINGTKLIVSNLNAVDPDFESPITVTVRVSDGTLFSEADVIFEFDNRG
jgi:hypothetical protein